MTYDKACLRMTEWLERNATESPEHPEQGYKEMDATFYTTFSSPVSEIHLSLLVEKQEVASGHRC
jgi:hypothetical protein